MSVHPRAEATALLVGESLVDIVRGRDGVTQEYAGGSAANSAVALARLGRPVHFVTAFTPDRLGTIVRAHLERDGVRFAADPAAIDHTSSAVATIGPDGAASYVFDLEWQINAATDLGEPWVIHTSSLAAVVEPGATQVAALIAGLRARATVSYDINARPSITGTGPDVVAAVERMAALADVVKCSDEDLDALYPQLDHPAAARHLIALGPTIVVVTAGGEGASWFTAAAAGHVPSVSVEVADTIGAGDTFGAAIVDALWERGALGGRLPALSADDWSAVLSYAARVAAVTVSRPGADPPYRHELG
ncbi:MAG: carbohydrate kinase [Nocardioides sp.]